MYWISTLFSWTGYFLYVPSPLTKFIIWGHCIEKNLPPISKCVDSPQQGKQIVLVMYLSNGVSHLEWCFSFFMVKKGFMLRNTTKSTFLGVVNLNCLISHKNWFLKFFGHSITQGCSEMLRPSAFRWHFQDFFWLFGEKEHFFHKKNVSYNFHEIVLFLKWLYCS